MSAERRLVQAERPNAQIVHLAHALNVVESLLHLLDVDALGDALHQTVEHILENLHGGDEHNDREEERADGIDDLVLGEEVDQQRRNQHAQALEKVADNVHEGSAHVDVALARVGIVSRVAAMLTTTSALLVVATMRVSMCGATTSVTVAMCTTTTSVTMAMWYSAQS